MSCIHYVNSVRVVLKCLNGVQRWNCILYQSQVERYSHISFPHIAPCRSHNCYLAQIPPSSKWINSNTNYSAKALFLLTRSYCRAKPVLWLNLPGYWCEKGGGIIRFVSRQMKSILSWSGIYKDPLETQKQKWMERWVGECGWVWILPMLFWRSFAHDVVVFFFFVSFLSKDYDLLLMLYWTEESVDREVCHVTYTRHTCKDLISV